MNFRYLLLILLAFPLFLTGCGDDDDAQPTQNDLQMQFYIKYAGEPVVLLESFDYAGDIDIYFTRFSFYISEITLLQGSNETEVLDAEMMNFTSNMENEDEANMGKSLIIEDVPPGNYSGIRFGLGVPPQLNSKTPVDFAPDHPLANSGEYWSGWQSYIFHKTEGRADLEGDGDFETPIALHVGSDTTYREVTFNSAFTIGGQSQNRLAYEIDLRSILIQKGIPYDIEANPQIHSLSQLDQAIQISDNFKESILERFE